MAVSYASVKRMFRETSGGLANPSMALAIIVWQEFTLPVDLDNEHSQWTYEYATSFSIGPMAGALLAGVCYNVMRHQSDLIKDFKKNELATATKVDMSQSYITHSEGLSTPNNQSFADERQQSPERKITTTGGQSEMFQIENVAQSQARISQE